MQEGPGGFWSYVHADDEYEEGRIVRLREQLQRSVRFHSGISSFEIFLDEKHIDWGQHWRDRIKDSLDNALLLFPILTPRYFLSEYCREEFFAFKERQRRLGRDDLILPIYYLTAEFLEGSGFDPDGVDSDQIEMVQYFRSHQREDFRPHRGSQETDLSYIRATDKLGQLVSKALKGLTRATSNPNMISPVDQVAQPFLARGSAMSIADENLQNDSAEALIAYYANERSVEIRISDFQIKLPFSCIIEPRGRGLCNEQPISFEVDPEKYELPETLHPFSNPVRDAALQKGHFDGIVFRLDRLRRSANGDSLVLRRASYFDALGSNFNMDSRDPRSGETLRQYLHGEDRRLCPFESDPLVNHLGVVIMVETVDGYLIVQERSGEVANRAHTRSSSISGSIKERQLERMTAEKSTLSLGDIAAVALEHGMEELAVRIDDLVFLGLFREFLRGGKPELYFFAKTKLSLLEVQAQLFHAEHRRETRRITGIEFTSGIDFGKIGLKSSDAWDFRIAATLNSIGAAANMTLIAGLLLSADYVKRQKLRGENSRQ